MENVRLCSTEKEKIAQTLLDGENFSSINMLENNIEEILQKERAHKFNNELEKLNCDLEEHNSNFKESLDNVSYDINKAEIKPMFARLLVKPFKVNPFLKLEMKGGIIVDTGGYNPHTQLNPLTGKYEELDQFIRTGCVIEVGPEVKYLKEGDVIYYRKDTVVPVPFFKQGFVSLSENLVIAAVNENLEKRFNTIK